MGWIRITADAANNTQLACKRGHTGSWEESENGKEGATRRCGECARNRARNHIYGLTDEAFEQLQQTDPVCAICGEDGTDCGFGKLEVDHDHDTEKVRGLLCRRCNIFLGHYERKKHLIPAIERYLHGRES